MNTTTKTKAQLQARIDELIGLNARLFTRYQTILAALAPFAQYAKIRRNKPIAGLGESVHAIHTSTEWEAEITLTHCENARQLVEKYGKGA